MSVAPNLSADVTLCLSNLVGVLKLVDPCLLLPVIRSISCACKIDLFKGLVTLRACTPGPYHKLAMQYKLVNHENRTH